MHITIELPKSDTPRTTVAAKTACDYVGYALSKLTAQEAWTDLMKNGLHVGTVDVDYIGTVKFTVTADK